MHIENLQGSSQNSLKLLRMLTSIGVSFVGLMDKFSFDAKENDSIQKYFQRVVVEINKHLGPS